MEVSITITQKLGKYYISVVVFNIVHLYYIILYYKRI